MLGDTDPTDDRVKAAVRLLSDELLGDFMFDDPAASKAHALALLLLPFVRPAINGPTPLHLVDASTQGSGKGLLCDVCAIPATGRPVATIAVPDNEDELRKRLMSALMAGSSHVAFDNIKRPLESPSLEMALTQGVVSERVLGVSENMEMPVNCIFTATGNNVALDVDMARRAVWIRLKTDTDKPWERSGFRHENLKQWAMDNRAALTAAAVTMVRKWIADGKPLFTARRKGSYESWAETMGGILASCGVPGFLDNEADLFETAQTDMGLMAEFVEAWWEKHQDKIVPTKTLFKIASHQDAPDLDSHGKAIVYEPNDLLAPLLGAGNERSRITKLGKLMKSWRDKVSGRYRITGHQGGRYKEWQLVQVDGTTAADVADVADVTPLPRAKNRFFFAV